MDDHHLENARKREFVFKDAMSCQSAHSKFKSSERSVATLF